VRQPYEYTTGFICTVSVFGLIVLMGIIGFTLKALDYTKGASKVFIAFSPYHNFMKLVLSTGAGNENLKLLDGLRVLSTLFVILGHVFTNSVASPYVNKVSM